EAQVVDEEHPRLEDALVGDARQLRRQRRRGRKAEELAERQRANGRAVKNRQPPPALIGLTLPQPLQGEDVVDERRLGPWLRLTLGVGQSDDVGGGFFDDHMSEALEGSED